MQQRHRQVVFQLDPGVGIAGSTPELLEDDFTRLPQRGIEGAEIELLEQMKRLRLRAGEVVPRVLPAKAVEALVEVFRRKALMDAKALDVFPGVEAAPEAAQVLPPGRRRRCERMVTKRPRHLAS